MGTGEGVAGSGGCGGCGFTRNTCEIEDNTCEVLVWTASVKRCRGGEIYPNRYYVARGVWEERGDT